ncbi:MAG: acetyl-CoA carboxylase biotin carboxyl carrier protein [Phycisphaerae bacterium]
MAKKPIKPTPSKSAPAAKPTPATSGRFTDTAKVKDLLKLMNEYGLSELELTEGAGKILLRRGSVAGASHVVHAAPVAHVAHAPVAAPTPAAAPAADDTAGLVAIKSPMVGTFYTAANPESPAFAKVGQQISDDSVVCIIEAMKVFNEIKAEASGTVVKILVNNGQVVEYGQPLFLIKPA